MPNPTPGQLEQHFPDLPWRTPLSAALGGVSGFVCRYCLAIHGLKGTDTHRVMPTPDDVIMHIAQVHGVMQEDPHA